jgi:hypothetical protein
MRILMPLAILLCLFGTSCEDEDNDEIVIKTGRECGWCVGYDSLVITEFSSNYKFRSPCDEPADKEKSRKTNRAEWNDLLAALNWDDFKNVNVNTCALCVDGCDTWIYIENNHESHKIRFTDNSTEIEPIRAFVEKLNALHEEFRSN